MAVAMDVAWRMELGQSSAGKEVMSKKRAWGADTEKLMHLMIGHFACPGSTSAGVAVTLDLLGCASPEREREVELECGSPEFLELDPDQPLPSGWEKCLDLKTGKLHFVNKSTGVKTSEDPRKPSPEHSQLQRPLAHEFLCSKREESLRTSTSCGSSGEQLLPLIATTKQHKEQKQKQQKQQRKHKLWNLDLNLSAGGSISPRSQHATPQQQPQQPQQGVCTMEMVERALKRTQSASSQSTSSSSSTSSHSHHPLRASSTPGVCEAESTKDETVSGALVMGACTRCLMYVMLNKSDPKCPRCERAVPVDFTSPSASKKHRVSLT